jgi:hypothetical protein
MGSTRGDYTGRNKQPLRLGSLIEHLWEEHLQRRHCFYSWIPHFCRIQCVKGEQGGTGNCPHGGRPPGCVSLYFMSSIRHRKWIITSKNRLSHKEHNVILKVEKGGQNTGMRQNYRVINWGTNHHGSAASNLTTLFQLLHNVMLTAP